MARGRVPHHAPAFAAQPGRRDAGRDATAPAGCLRRGRGVDPGVGRGARPIASARVAITLGTAVPDRAETLAPLAAAFADLDAEIVVTTGPGVDVEALGAVPRNVARRGLGPDVAPAADLRRARLPRRVRRRCWPLSRSACRSS